MNTPTPTLTKSQRYWLKVKLSGVCTKCGEPAVVFRYCQKHNSEYNAHRREQRANGPKYRSEDRSAEARAHRAEAQRAWRAAQKALRQCIDCAEPTAGGVRCAECARANTVQTTAGYWATRAPVRRCGTCRQLGHNSKTCPEAQRVA